MKTQKKTSGTSSARLRTLRLDLAQAEKEFEAAERQVIEAKAAAKRARKKLKKAKRTSRAARKGLKSLKKALDAGQLAPKHLPKQSVKKPTRAVRKPPVKKKSSTPVLPQDALPPSQSPLADEQLKQRVRRQAKRKVQPPAAETTIAQSSETTVEATV